MESGPPETASTTRPAGSGAKHRRVASITGSPVSGSGSVRMRGGYRGNRPRRIPVGARTGGVAIAGRPRLASRRNNGFH